MANRSADRCQHRIRELAEPVMDPESVAPRFDQAGAAQIRQMPRRFRLRDLEGFVNVADADFAGQQQAQNAEPGDVGERPEQRFHMFELPVHISALTNIT